MPPLISAVLLVRNEEDNLPLALRSLQGWVDEVVVVDGQSTDRTAEVARSSGARVFVRPPAGTMEEDGAFAVAQSTGAWVFHLDADEVVPAALGRRLRAAAEAGTADVIEVPEMSHFLGARCNVWRGRKARLFRRDAFHVTDRIHRMFDVKPSARRLALPAVGQPLQHYWVDGVGPLLQRLDRYTAAEARQAPAAGERRPRPLRRFLRAFLGAYFIDGGARNGWRGAYLSLHRGFYAATVEVRRAEAALGGAAAIRAGYRKDAAAILDPSGA